VVASDNLPAVVESDSRTAEVDNLTASVDNPTAVADILDLAAAADNPELAARRLVAADIQAPDSLEVAVRTAESDIPLVAAEVDSLGAARCWAVADNPVVVDNPVVDNPAAAADNLVADNPAALHSVDSPAVVDNPAAAVDILAAAAGNLVADNPAALHSVDSPAVADNPAVVVGNPAVETCIPAAVLEWADNPVAARPSAVVDTQVPADTPAVGLGSLTAAAANNPGVARRTDCTPNVRAARIFRQSPPLKD
jgi:hypothetical protein